MFDVECLQEEDKHESGEKPATTDSVEEKDSQIDLQPINVQQINNNDAETTAQGAVQVLNFYSVVVSLQ